MKWDDVRWEDESGGCELAGAQQDEWPTIRVRLWDVEMIVGHFQNNGITLEPKVATLHQEL